MSNELQDEVLRKIGRNVVDLQRLEMTLKAIVGGNHIAGSLSEIKSVRQRKMQAARKLTLGQVASEFLASTFNAIAKEPPREASEPWIAVGFSQEIGESELTIRKAELSKVVDERNQLIHGILYDFDLDSKESCRALIIALDEQHARFKPQLEEAVDILRHMGEMRESIESIVWGQLSSPPDDRNQRRR